MSISTQTSASYLGLEPFLQAGRSLVFVQTFEEDRLEKLLTSASTARHQELWIWGAHSGLTAPGLKDHPKAAEAALATALQTERRPILWMKDVHHHYRPEVVRALRDIYYHWRNTGAVVILSATVRVIPPELEREAAIWRLPIAGQDELCASVATWSSDQGYDLGLENEVVAATLRGLTSSEVFHSLARVQAEGLNSSDALMALQEEKRRLIDKTGTLEFIPRVPRVDELGGLEHLKDWLLKRRSLMTSNLPEDRDIIPKGMLLMGVSGCGKSLCVKAVSSAWQLPLYRLEMVRVFSGSFGSPETAFAEACHLMEELAPAVLWIDEIEMGLSADGSAAVDPTLSRIFAFFLTWMQEKSPGLFVAATANRIDLLPAEMIRKGRFDQVFFVDLPTAGEREEIFKIHLEKRGYVPANFTPEVFADATNGWSGAEIEQCVVSAVTTARMERRDLELKDLYASRKSIVPLSTTMEEQVRHIRNWAYERATRASASS